MTFTILGETITVLSLLGMLAFAVMIVTEMLKGIWIFKKTPTKLTALLVSFAVVLGAMTAYLDMAQESFSWWYLPIAFFAAFIVGYLSINGWDNLFDIWHRFVPGSTDKTGGRRK